MTFAVFYVVVSNIFFSFLTFYELKGLNCLFLYISDVVLKDCETDTNTFIVNYFLIAVHQVNSILRHWQSIP